MEGEVRWIELLSSERERLEALGRELGIHPLAIEDCLHSNQRAKFEDFENHQLLVWFGFFEESSGRAGLEVYELEFVVFPQTLILVSSDPPPKGKTWREFLGVNPATHRDSSHLLYQALDRAMDLTTNNLRPLMKAIDEFEDKLLLKAGDPRELMALKRQLTRAEFSLSYLSSVVGQWQRYLNPKDDLRWRLRDLWDHCERFHQSLMFGHTQIAWALDMYWGMTAKRTNDQIKKLTLLASIAVPTTFWASFWGMNFESIPFKNPNLFYLALGLMAASVVGMYFLLKRKGYWERD